MSVQRFFEMLYNIAARLPKGSVWWKGARAIFLFGNKVLRKNQNPKKESIPDLQTLMSCLQVIPSTPISASIGPVDIILPIYNGYEQCVRLWKSLRDTLRTDDTLIIVDDASTDGRIGDLLNEIQRQRSNVSVIRHGGNLGFVKSVNEAATQAVHHMVILNSDVEVPPGWLERLMRPIVFEEKIASTTPMTNAGEICSFPEFLQDNPLPDNTSTADVDNLFRYLDASKIPCVIPTGVGFCMGLNKQVVDSIGLFDEDAFGRGYGEENDWCMRASARGYKHLLVPNLFVFHEHGSSFSRDEKLQLRENNLRLLTQRHPEYPLLIRNYIVLDPLRNFRDLLHAILRARFQSTKRCLIIDHELGGGSQHYREQLMRDRIEKKETVLLVTYSLSQKKIILTIAHEEEIIEFSLDHFEWDIYGLLRFIPIDEMIVSELVSFPAPLNVLAQLRKMHDQYQCAITFCLHDYFSLCPSYNLLNDHGSFCKLPAMEECERCLPANRNEFRAYYPSIPPVVKWREEWSCFLNLATTIECYSQYSEDLLIKAYPNISPQRIALKPHRVSGLRRIHRDAKRHDRCVIGILGRITEEKGLAILKDMLGIIKDRKLSYVRCVVVGNTLEHLHHPHLQITSSYIRDDLPRLVEKNQIDIIFIPSIWPETFSFTTEEALLMGIPVAVFDIGAPAERIRASGSGIVIEKIEAEYALDKILEYWKSQQGIPVDEA